MKKRDLLKRIETLDRQLDAIATRQQDQIDSLATKYAALLEAVGGAFWRTKNGSTRALIALSTEHLRNILAVMQPPEPMHGCIRDEIQRRTLDELYREHAKARTKKARAGYERQIVARGGMRPSVLLFGRPSTLKVR